MIMVLELLDESKIKKTGKSDIKIDPAIDKKIKLEINTMHVKKKGLEFIKKENIASCERRENGMTDNCALCEALDHETFNRCPNKWL